jgi:hypothetical protein
VSTKKRLPLITPKAKAYQTVVSFYLPHAEPGTRRLLDIAEDFS